MFHLNVSNTLSNHEHSLSPQFHNLARQFGYRAIRRPTSLTFFPASPDFYQSNDNNPHSWPDSLQALELHESFDPLQFQSSLIHRFSVFEHKLPTAGDLFISARQADYMIQYGYFLDFDSSLIWDADLSTITKCNQVLTSPNISLLWRSEPLVNSRWLLFKFFLQRCTSDEVSTRKNAEGLVSFQLRLKCNSKFCPEVSILTRIQLSDCRLEFGPLYHNFSDCALFSLFIPPFNLSARYSELKIQMILGAPDADTLS